MNMPVKAMAMPTAPGTTLAGVINPPAVRLKASASVAVVKNTPSACTSSSFSMPIACMNGIEGITCTPVEAEITPVITPTTPPAHFSFLSATWNLNLLSPMMA